ncbi:MAG TPA: FUSC family protein, partial [Acidimicrobiales bacterium]|nr:FUSC family protein [Acidimicrobiales bacterium]
MSGLIRPAFRIDRSQIDVRAGIQCAIAIAVPLAVGIGIGHPLQGAWGAIGAFLVNFSTFQPGFRFRVRIVVAAAVVVAAGTFLGALTGIESPAVFPLMAGWSFLAGLLVALGPNATMVGVVSSVGMAIATALAATATVAGEDGASALAGGLVAAGVALAFHWRGQRAEGAALAAAYRTLAAYAAGIAAGAAAALPDGEAFEMVAATLAVPGNHRTRYLAARDRALAERAERLRIVLAGLAVARSRLATHSEGSPERRAAAAVDAFAAATGPLLTEAADCCLTDQPPAAGAGDGLLLAARRQLQAVAEIRTVPIDELFEETRSALTAVGVLLAGGEVPAAGRPVTGERTVGVATPVPGEPPVDAGHPQQRPRRLAHRPDLAAEAWLSIRANLTLRSTTCRHALRLAVTVTVATVLYRVIDVHDGYWIVVAVLFIMKPDFGATVGRGILRAVGTLVGLTLTTLVLAYLKPGSAALAVVTVVASLFAYSLFNANYGAFTVFLTCLTVSLAAFLGLPAVTAISNRAVDNLIAAGLAIVAVAVWPTWVATALPELVASCLRAEHRFVDAVLSVFIRVPAERAGSEPARSIDEAAIDRLIRDARLARSNAEAAVLRMAAETPGAHKGGLTVEAAEGILAQMHRF